MGASSCDGGEVFECALWCVFYALSEGVDGVFEVVVGMRVMRACTADAASMGMLTPWVAAFRSSSSLTSTGTVFMACPFVFPMGGMVVVKLFLFRSMSCMVCSFGGVVGDADDVDEEHAQGQWVAVVEDSGCCDGLFE